MDIVGGLGDVKHANEEVQKYVDHVKMFFLLVSNFIHGLYFKV